MNGETEFTNVLVYRFAAHHRANYGGCKTGLIDVLTGAVTYLTQIQGTAGASHVRDKVTEMIHLGETLYSSSIACAAEGWPTPSGAYMVDTMLANVGKHNATRFHFEVARLAADLAGGFLATLPSEYDLNSEETGHLVKKYFSGVAGIPTEERIKIGRLIESMTGGTALVESMHGAGSPQAQRVMIFREGDLDKKVKLAKALAGISPDRIRKGAKMDCFELEARRRGGHQETSGRASAGERCYDIVGPPSDGDFGPGSLLVVQGVDGVEQGRLVGGIETEEEPYEAGKAEGHEDGQRGNDGRPTGQGRKDLRPRNADDDAGHAADEGERQRLDDELQPDIPGLGPHGHADADLPGPFRHGDEHDVHDADAPHQQRDGCDRRQKETHNLGGLLSGLHHLG